MGLLAQGNRVIRGTQVLIGNARTRPGPTVPDKKTRNLLVGKDAKDACISQHSYSIH